MSIGIFSSALTRISRAFEKACEISFSDTSKLVIMSDCHRGTGDWADTFADNQNIFYAALEHYNKRKFTYIELGDGDELWENKRLSETVSTYSRIFCLMSRFYQDDRLYLVYGNHDIEKRNTAFFMRHFDRFYDAKRKREFSLFPDIRIHESLILRHTATGNGLYLLHGHQADFLSGPLWRLSRFLVRYLWKPLESLGVNDPTSTSKNRRRKSKVEKTLMQWARQENRIVIAGHTHKPAFPEPGMPLYFNDGSCVRRRSVTALEIVYGQITLVQWGYQTRADGTIYVEREILAGPRKLREFFDRLNQQDAPLGPSGYGERPTCY